MFLDQSVLRTRSAPVLCFPWFRLVVLGVVYGVGVLRVTPRPTPPREGVGLGEPVDPRGAGAPGRPGGRVGAPRLPGLGARVDSPTGAMRELYARYGTNLAAARQALAARRARSGPSYTYIHIGAPRWVGLDLLAGPGLFSRAWPPPRRGLCGRRHWPGAQALAPAGRGRRPLDAGPGPGRDRAGGDPGRGVPPRRHWAGRRHTVAGDQLGLGGLAAAVGEDLADTRIRVSLGRWAAIRSDVEHRPSAVFASRWCWSRRCRESS